MVFSPGIYKVFINHLSIDLYLRSHGLYLCHLSHCSVTPWSDPTIDQSELKTNLPWRETARSLVTLFVTQWTSEHWLVAGPPLAWYASLHRCTGTGATYSTPGTVLLKLYINYFILNIWQFSSHVRGYCNVLQSLVFGNAKKHFPFFPTRNVNGRFEVR